jgi:peptide/nickel transport system ATP-binding protein
MSSRDARIEAQSLVDAVGLSRRLGDRYPRELSGGERQRVAIGRALAAQPAILVCDEVTSALDVSVQATVLDLLSDLQSEFRLSLLFISHDLGVVASLCDRALVLESGVVREEGRVEELLSRPTHEYTRLLIDSAPRVQAALT